MECRQRIELGVSATDGVAATDGIRSVEMKSAVNLILSKTYCS
jgi:hypothetical protein